MSSHSGTKAESGKENLYAENLYALFRSRFPEDLAQVFLETGQGSVYSYGDLERETARYAAFLTGLGLAKGIASWSRWRSRRKRCFCASPVFGRD